MTTYTIECGGFTGTGLANVAAVQQWLDDMKARFSLKGEQVRVYRFINGSHIGKPDFVGVVAAADAAVERDLRVAAIKRGWREMEAV